MIVCIQKQQSSEQWIVKCLISMGKVLSVLNRQINRFNVENRAQRVLARDKPTPAPRHPSTKKNIEEFLIATQDYKDELMKKQEQLDKNLRQVYVTSHNVPQAHSKPSERSRLPLSRKTVEETELGYEEPEIIPIGHITLRQILEILAKHREDSQKYNISFVCNEYKLKEEDARNLFRYFLPFEVYIPENLPIKTEKTQIYIQRSEPKKGELEKTGNEK